MRGLRMLDYDPNTPQNTFPIRPDTPLIRPKYVPPNTPRNVPVRTYGNVSGRIDTFH
jgi:hypothetical protein